ncbi:MAG: hypothetical protein RL708_1202 [Bacteroidota bacterium]|jgi:methionine aminotransferase
MNQYPSILRSKLPNVGTTIFTVMSALANEHKAINLSQGFPDFEVDEKLISLIHQYYQKGMNQYAPMPGLLQLRETIAEKCNYLYGITIHPETEITITPGGTEAIFSAITSIIHPDDEVIIFEPAYDCYAPAIELCGGVPVYIELKAPNFTIDWNDVKKRINHKTKLIIINTPHNPGGSTMTENDMLQLQKLIETTDIMLLSDEVYEHIIFDNEKHQSVLRFPKLAERSFAVYSFGKTLHATGWKVGYVIAPENMMKEFRKVHQFNVFSTNTPIQYALNDYLKDRNNYLYLPKFYEEKRNYFNQILTALPFKFIPAKGSYFQCVDYSQISDEADKDFAIRLTKEYGVAAVPVSAFYHRAKDNKMLRFCFAKKRETLDAAAEKLSKIK